MGMDAHSRDICLICGNGLSDSKPLCHIIITDEATDPQSPDFRKFYIKVQCIYCSNICYRRLFTDNEAFNLDFNFLIEMACGQSVYRIEAPYSAITIQWIKKANEDEQKS